MSNLPSPTTIETVRIGIQQRVLPDYRRAFFVCLAEQFGGRLSLFAGQPTAQEGIRPLATVPNAKLTLGVNLHLFHPSHPLYLCWQLGLLRWLGEWQPQVLIVEANPRYPATRLAVHWMHRRGGKVLGWGLGAPPLRGFLAPLRQAQRTDFLRSLDGVIAYSRRGAREYRWAGLPPERVFTAVNAVARRPTVPPPPKPATFGSEPKVLFVGRLQARKRVDLLLRACAELPARLQPQLAIVGDGPHRPALEELAARIYPKAHFLGDRRGPGLDEAFAWADLFVLPGTGGLAAQQAMAHGLPLIIAQGDGTQEDLVRPAVNGWLLPPDDLDALKRALVEALSDAARLRQMGQESFRIAVEEVNVEAMVAVFEQAISTLLSS
ncbi:MAG: glycosyltransferase [Anaerolineales bacterium]|nr:glycosyltransferase [Anaerolineales bacterium]MCS7248572.1 glycosyltransferase [Anaerolineales bacterium]MDW8162385.1 glycosyltransferase [Anaerolineales bacterium]MDW8447730.1 glycosyltransferase [Anaerolineales bacterium]